MTIPSRRRYDTDSTISQIPIRVLIVDDDPTFRAYLTMLTRRNGATILTAVDGEEGLARLRSESVDLLLCDYEMPKLNGLELITEVRGDPALSGLYAVMMTAHSELALKVHALSLGYDDFLSKSCSEIEVAARVAAARRMLSRQKALDLAVQEWQGIAFRDELTGVASRRLFFEETSASLAEGQDIGIVLLDLDDFKSVNDAHGHLVGDRMLRDVGAMLLQGTRQEDLIARYGGDEFVLLVRGSSIEETRVVGERLTTRIGDMRWTAGGMMFGITCSYGIGFSALVTEPTTEKIIDAADRELYAQKWLRKHPSATPAEFYEYSAGASPAIVIRLKEPAEPAAPDDGESATPQQQPQPNELK